MHCHGYLLTSVALRTAFHICPPVLRLYFPCTDVRTCPVRILSIRTYARPCDRAALLEHMHYVYLSMYFLNCDSAVLFVLFFLSYGAQYVAGLHDT